MIIRLCLSLLVLLTFGYLFVKSIQPLHRQASADIFLKACLAIGFSFGITSYIYFLVLIFIGPSITALLLSECSFIFVWYFIKNSIKKGRDCGCVEMSEKILLPSGYQKILSIAFYSGLFSSFTAYVLMAIKLPNGGWDAWAIWNLHARFVFRAREHWTDVFSTFLATGSHPDYPFLVPATVARLWEYIGKETQLAPALVAMLFTFAGIMTSR